MKCNVKILCFLFAAALASSAVVSAEVSPYPKIKSGEWSTTVKNEMNIPGMPAAMKNMMGDIKMVYCVDDKSQDKMFQQAQKGLTDCGKPDVKKNGNTYTANISCKRNGQVTNVISATTLLNENTFTNSTTVKSNKMGDMVMKSKANYVGACKDGRKPGDYKVLNSGMPNLGGMDMKQLEQMGKQLQNMQMGQ